MPLKKIVIYACIFIITGFDAHAQIQKDESDPLGYGIKLGINFPTVGTQYEQLSGLAGGNLGLFFTQKISNHFSWYIEPGFSSVRFRDKTNDTRFNNYYIDAGAFTYFYPSAYNTDFAFIGGIRPSYLLSYNSQVFEFGAYSNQTLAVNHNKTGKIDASLMLGMSVALSPVLNFELTYHHSLTNNNSPAHVEGRPSTVDLTVRLNAVALRRSLDGRNQSMAEQVQQYHKGVLLVMLLTPNEKEVKRLLAENRTDDADLLVTEIRNRNAKVIREFGRNYSFTPVYYFLDSNIYKVISGNLNGIFVNGNQDPDTTIKVNTENFFIASFCEDISDYTKRKHFGLFVYDRGMNQLDKPFNHPNQLASPVFEYVVVNNQENKTRRPSYITVPFDKLIGKLNTRLFRFVN